MLTEYDIQQQARERRTTIVNESERMQVQRIAEGVGKVYSFENDARRRARLSAERSKRQAAERGAYIADRVRHRALAAVADIQDAPFDWERDRRTEFALNGPSTKRPSYLR